MKTATGLALLLLAPLLLVVVPLAGRLSQSCDPGGGSTGATAVAVGRPVSGQLDAVQRANAATIIDAAVSRGLGREGAVIGVMTALTESSLRNLDYGDSVGPDSRGLFQQRSDWGPLTVRTSPNGASALFFGALQAVPGWRSMRPWTAAQAVQRSAFEDGSNYRANYATAARLVAAALSGSATKFTSIEARTAPMSVAPTSTACAGGTWSESADVPLPPAPVPYRGGSTGCAIADPTGTGGCVTGATAHLLRQTEAAFGSEWPWGVSCWDEHAWSPGSDHPLGRACDFTVGRLGHYPTQQQARIGWSLAQWYRTYAARLHVDYVIWDGRIWSTSRADEGWRRYDGGGIYSTASVVGGHHDHAHVSLQN